MTVTGASGERGCSSYASTPSKCGSSKGEMDRFIPNRSAVDLDLAQSLDPPKSKFEPDPKALTLGNLIRDFVPSKIQAAIGRKEIRKYSNAIGHDLAFDFA